MKKIAIYISILFFFAYACELEDPEVDHSPTWPLNGEWWVTYRVDVGGELVDIYDWGYTRLLTFNTAATTADSIWITDQGNFWTFQVKAGINLQAKSFSVTEGTEIVYDDATTIQNGQVVEMAGGDSIYMEIEWESDPGTIYVCSGRRVKGFLDNSGGTSYEADYGD